ncbi:MAG TPA: hypothetical protein VFT46_00085 [Holophagaceae bacterium]|nr:hypothetical protein [Holophagaceae bacterium]
MRRGLALYAVLVLLAMVGVTTWASLHEGVFAATARMLRDPWSVATFFDAYFGFLWFLLWIAATERSLALKVLSLPLILAFGNLAMAAYVLFRLTRMEPGSGFRGFLLGAR